MYGGQRFLQGVYDTLRSNEQLWRKTMLVITYDEHGGFYDHVIPPIAEVRSRPMALAPDDSGGGGPVTPSTLVTPYGVRVPTFVVSPWTAPGKGPDIVLDHCSILKTVLARFCGQGAVPQRPGTWLSVIRGLSVGPEPRMDVPALPPIAPLPREPPAGGRS